MAKIRPPVKIHGGKFYLSPWVIENFPKDYHELSYCELCCGGGSVFLNKKKSGEEVICDMDKGIISIFKALRDVPNEFIARLREVKYSDETFKLAMKKLSEPDGDYVDVALNEYVVRRMSRGGMKKAFAWSERLRGGIPGDLNAWHTMLDLLPTIAERVKDTIMLNQDCMDTLGRWDDRKVLVYLDPPYLHETRVSKDVYDQEMTFEKHEKILTRIRDCRCKVILSGYPSTLYNKYLNGWRTVTKEVANHSGQHEKKERRTECLWMNY